MATGAASDETQFEEWQRSSFNRAALPTAVAKGDILVEWVTRAVHSDPVRGVAALMYHLHRPACSALARDFVTDEWVEQLLQDRGTDPEVLELCVLLADASFCRDVIMRDLASRVSEGPYSQALARALSSYALPDLLTRTAHALADLGFAEILENESLLSKWTVAHGYIALMSDDQYSQLCDRIELVCGRDILARWLSDDAPATDAAVPDAPAQFYDAASLWRWIYEKLIFADADLAAAWLNSRERAPDVFAWWQALQSPGAEPESGAAAAVRQLNLRSTAESPHFQIRLGGKAWDPPNLLVELKSEAAAANSIYGQSAPAARVALRGAPEKAAILDRLEPIEVLSASEADRYFFLYGADIATLSVTTAVRLAHRDLASAAPQSAAQYDLVTFEESAPFELVASALVHVFPPSCRPSATRVGNDRLGLLRRPSR